MQNGPVTPDRNELIHPWCAESHQALLENHFANELIIRLDRRLHDCECNWQDELVLIVVTVLTMRILTICDSAIVDQVIGLVYKCRRIGEKWIELISQTIQNISSADFAQVETLRGKIVIIGIACLLTFSTHSGRIHLLLSSSYHVISLLKASTTVHDQTILNKKQNNASVFIRNLKRQSDHALVKIQKTVSEFLHKTSYQSLNDFCTDLLGSDKKLGYD